MIRDVKWAYELGFKRGWKVGNRRGRRHKSGGEVDKTLSNVTDEPLISEILSEGSSSGTISFDTEIRASGTSDTLHGNECDHQVVAWFTVSFIEWLIEQGYFVFCPKCGEKL